MWTCYSLVLEKLATMTEVETLLSIDDVDRLRIAADAYFDAVNAPEPRKDTSDEDWGKE